MRSRIIAIAAGLVGLLLLDVFVLARPHHHTAGVQVASITYPAGRAAANRQMLVDARAATRSNIRQHISAVRLAALARAAKLARLRAEAAARAAAARATQYVRDTSGPALFPEPWNSLARCESGYDGSWRVDSGSYYRGYFQFDPSTWASVGGSGDPAAASPSEQLMRAQILQRRDGWNPWPVCARKVGLL